MKIAGIEITHPERMIFPAKGITKGDVAEYYNRMAAQMLPYLKDRPLTIERFPEGLEGSGFYQKHAQEYFPDFIERVTVDTKEGKAEEFMANNRESLIYLANQGTISFHIWLSTKQRLKRPDKVVFDLDPSGNDFGKVKKVAKLLKTHLEEDGHTPAVMTTGKRGLHIYYNISPKMEFDAVRESARKLGEKLVDAHPSLVTLETRKNKRGNKIFIDTLRNAYAQTSICPFSLRPNAEAGVATPIEWKELSNLKGGAQYHYQNIFRRLAAKAG